MQNDKKEGVTKLTKKQECVKAAYGDKYTLLKKDISEDGLIYSSDLKEKLSKEEIKELQLETVGEGDYPAYDDLMRPKSLQGIEDNRGWFSIKEHGLPIERCKEYNWYDANSKSSQTFEYTSRGDVWILHNFTHYKPIEKQLLPLY